MRLRWRTPFALIRRATAHAVEEQALQDRLRQAEAERDACLQVLSGVPADRIADRHPDLADFLRPLSAAQPSPPRMTDEGPQMQALLRDCQCIAKGHLRPLDLDTPLPGAATGLTDVIRDGLGHWANALGPAQEGLARATRTAADLTVRATGLRDRTAAQIDLVQGVTFSLDLVSELARNNSAFARQSCGLADQTQMAARDMAKGLSGLNDAMSRIAEVSRQITGVVARIEDIAFQTNMLALNAGIQAAQAGEAGRGFAVVAAEVRVLAGSTRELAESITAMAQESLDAVQGAERHSHRADEQMSGIVRMSGEVLDLLRQVQTVSGQQATQVTDLLGSVQTTTAAAAETARLAATNCDVLADHDLALQSVGGSLATVSVDTTLWSPREPDPLVAPPNRLAAGGTGGHSIELF